MLMQKARFSYGIVISYIADFVSDCISLNLEMQVHVEHQVALHPTLDMDLICKVKI